MFSSLFCDSDMLQFRHRNMYRHAKTQFARNHDQIKVEMGLFEEIGRGSTIDNHVTCI